MTNIYTEPQMCQCKDGWHILFANCLVDTNSSEKPTEEQLYFLKLGIFAERERIFDLIVEFLKDRKIEDVPFEQFENMGAENLKEVFLHFKKEEIT